jgi:hypothetical protein
MAAISGKDVSEANGFRLIIVGGKLSQGKPKEPIILLVGYRGIGISF